MLQGGIASCVETSRHRRMRAAGGTVAHHGSLTDVALGASGEPPPRASRILTASKPCYACGSCAIMTPTQRKKGTSLHGIFASSPRANEARDRAEAGVAQGARARRPQLHPAQGAHARVEPALGVRGGALSQHRRVLGG